MICNNVILTNNHNWVMIKLAPLKIAYFFEREA